MKSAALDKGRFFHYHPSIIGHDAIGYSLMALHELLRSLGFDSFLVCSDDNWIAKNCPKSCISATQMFHFGRKSDTVIFHYSFYDTIISNIIASPMRSILVYHNITPGFFFRGIKRNDIAGACDAGRDVIASHVSFFDACVGVSDFNSQDLRKFGCREPVTIPVFLSDVAFQKADVDVEFVHRVRSKNTVNLLFVGRFVPNKRVDRLIDILAEYKARFCDNVHLHLVGKIWDEKYFTSLMEHAAHLGVLKQMTTYIDAPFTTLRSLYALSDAFICASEHEGFMVPVLEAFAAGCPVIAYGCTAVAETMGDGGIVLSNLDTELMSAYIESIRTSRKLRHDVVKKQAHRLQHFSKTRTSDKWMNFLQLETKGAVL